jgi:hypothetical protein
MEQTLDVMLWIRDALGCLGVLVGLVSAIFLIVRKKPAMGILALAGFLLLSAEPLLDMVLLRLFLKSSSGNWQVIDTIYICCSGISLLLGPVLIAVAFFLGLRPDPVKVEEVPLPQA